MTAWNRDDRTMEDTAIVLLRWQVVRFITGKPGIFPFIMWFGGGGLGISEAGVGSHA